MNKQRMADIFKGFADLLETRMSQNVLTTEDSVRYTFFASMLNNGVGAHEVILEDDHPKIERAKIDTCVDFKGKSVAIEFKYDRPASNRNMNKTDRAGAVFADLKRLNLAHDAYHECYLVYVTSKEMHGYFINPGNRHVEFYNLPSGSSFEIADNYFEDRPPTFLQKIKKIDGEFTAKITNILKRELSQEHHLSVYRVDRV